MGNGNHPIRTDSDLQDWFSKTLHGEQLLSRSRIPYNHSIIRCGNDTLAIRAEGDDPDRPSASVQTKGLPTGDGVPHSGYAVVGRSDETSTMRAACKGPDWTLVPVQNGGLLACSGIPNPGDPVGAKHDSDA